MLASYWAILSSMMAATITRRAQNPCVMSWNCRAVLTRVLMMALMNFHRTLIMPTLRVSAFIFWLNIIIVHIRYLGRVICYHMWYTRVTYFPNVIGWGELCPYMGKPPESTNWCVQYESVCVIRTYESSTGLPLPPPTPLSQYHHLSGRERHGLEVVPPGGMLPLVGTA